VVPWSCFCFRYFFTPSHAFSYLASLFYFSQDKAHVRAAATELAASAKHAAAAAEIRAAYLV
jgi:hypothetical protein